MVLLSAVGVRAVVQLQWEEGRQLLRELLGWEPFDEDCDLRRSIRLDILYNSIMFAARKGLSWAAVATVGKIAEELLEEMKGEGELSWCDLV
uniref:Uncharacterized protein n=1 Tax=Dromaius novaehollandiae TaxID=8790 RepID=A0A8C4P8N0_DRONO